MLDNYGPASCLLSSMRTSQRRHQWHKHSLVWLTLLFPHKNLYNETQFCPLETNWWCCFWLWEVEQLKWSFTWCRTSWVTLASKQETRCWSFGLSPPRQQTSKSMQRSWGLWSVQMAKCRWRTWTGFCCVSDSDYLNNTVCNNKTICIYYAETSPQPPTRHPASTGCSPAFWPAAPPSTVQRLWLR